MLDVADVLNKAISSVPGSQLEESQSLKDLHQGLQLTESQLLKVFSKHGLVQENPLGEKFDPNKHDALFQVLFIVIGEDFAYFPNLRFRPQTRKPTQFWMFRRLVTFSTGGPSDLLQWGCPGSRTVEIAFTSFF